MAERILVVDLRRILDETEQGRAGAAALQKRFDDAKAEHATLKARAATTKGKRQAEELAAQFASTTLETLERERATLREAVLARARPIVAELVQERGASVVIDAAACLAVAPDVDVTDVVIERMERR